MKPRVTLRNAWPNCSNQQAVEPDEAEILARFTGSNDSPSQRVGDTTRLEPDLKTSLPEYLALGPLIRALATETATAALSSKRAVLVEIRDQLPQEVAIVLFLLPFGRSVGVAALAL